MNPARPTHQLVGVYDDALRPVMAEALGRLGLRRAWVVRSEDGLDEVSPTGRTRISVLENGRVTERTIGPSDLGVAPIALEALRGGDATENAGVLTSILEHVVPVQESHFRNPITGEDLEVKAERPGARRAASTRKGLVRVAPAPGRKPGAKSAARR